MLSDAAKSPRRDQHSHQTPESCASGNPQGCRGSQHDHNDLGNGAPMQLPSVMASSESTVGALSLPTTEAKCKVVK